MGMRNISYEFELRLSASEERSQRLLQICLQVIDMLDANRQAHHVLRDAGFGQFGRIELAVGGRCRMGRQRFGVADIHQPREQLQRIEHPRTGGARVGVAVLHFG